MEELQDFTDRNGDNRIISLGMDMSHRWVSYDGDCWDGIHSHVMCYDCMLEPFWECYHELPKSNVKIYSRAFEPCTHEEIDED